MVNYLQNTIAKTKSDFFIINSTINDETADEFIRLIRDKPLKQNKCSIILTTYGGDPDAGYRIVRAIKRYYEKFVLYVFGTCKSTGTLIALGSDEIVMSDFGEFGPLDIQLTKEDELSHTSGLSYLQSLISLNEQIFRSFEMSFVNLKRRSGFFITTKTAAEISSKLAVGLISPISAQLDPVKLGEVQRAIMIADAYGRRLCDDVEIISKLITGYPSHGFVIDYEESKQIFPNVRFVDEDEARVERKLLKLIRNEGEQIIINDLSSNIEIFNENNIDNASNTSAEWFDENNENKEEVKNV